MYCSADSTIGRVHFRAIAILGVTLLCGVAMTRPAHSDSVVVGNNSGEDHVADGIADFFRFDRSAAIVALDAMGVYGRPLNTEIPYSPDQTPRIYEVVSAEASRDWEVLIDPHPGLTDTAWMQLEFGVAGFGTVPIHSQDYTSNSWAYLVQVGESAVPVFVSSQFSTPIPNLQTSMFEVPVGTPFNLRQTLRGRTRVDELKIDPTTEFYDIVAEFDFIAAPQAVNYFDADFNPVDATYTVNGGPAPLHGTPPTQVDLFSQFVRAAIRGEIDVGNPKGDLNFTGIGLEPLASNMPFRTVSMVENAMGQLRFEEVSLPYTEERILIDEYVVRQERANTVSSLLRAAVMQPTYEQFLNENIFGVGEVLVQGLIDLFIGSDPFFGLYTADQPLTLPPPNPSTFTFSSGPNAAGVTLLLPPVLGGGSASPEVLVSQVTVRFESGQVELLNLTTDIASYEILGGQQTGVNRGFYPAGGQVWSDVNLLTGEVVAYGEGLITNDLYPAERPIFVFQDISGRVLDLNGELVVEVVADNEPMIVPGPPGGPPSSQPIAFAATRARYDASTLRLHLTENTDASLAPDISVVLTPEDVFGVSLDNTAEPLIGAEVHVDPLRLRVLADNQDIQFFDTAFEIRNDDGVFAGGTFSQVRIDLTIMALVADVSFDAIADLLASPFIEDWQSDPDRVILLGRIGTLDLLADTQFLSISGSSATDFMAFTRAVQPIPEPSAMVLGLLASLGFCFVRSPRRLFGFSGSVKRI